MAVSRQKDQGPYTDLLRWQMRGLLLAILGVIVVVGLRILGLVWAGRSTLVEPFELVTLASCGFCFILLRRQAFFVAAWFFFLSHIATMVVTALVIRVNMLAFLPLVIAGAGFMLRPNMVLVIAGLCMGATVSVGLSSHLPFLDPGSIIRPSHALVIQQYLSLEGLATMLGWSSARFLHDLVGESALAQRHSHLKSAFLARMSHEIRTPLNGVVGMVQVLRESGLNVHQQASLATLSRAGDALMGIVNNVQDLSKIEAGHLQLVALPFDLWTFMVGVGALFRPEATRKGLTLTIAPEVPRWVIGDALRVGQIATNLISNAVKFTEQGTVAVSLDGGWGDAPQVRLTVADTGIGIPPQQAETIFDDYVQGLDSETIRSQGTGLGLAICRQLTVAMDGRIWFDSPPGKGTAFMVEVLLPPGTPPQLPDPQDHAPVRHLRVLVAEDDPISQEALRTL
ncbi:MAG: hypothetical protein H7338_02515, partial [Candidatus Sericytochromatia bacterium]|nr:hypothetical protein [Candidatus Sericytochromatia bacterium]